MIDEIRMTMFVLIAPFRCSSELSAHRTRFFGVIRSLLCNLEYGSSLAYKTR